MPEESSEFRPLPSSADECQVIHRIPGRTRFRIPLLGEDPDSTVAVRAVLESTSGVTDIRINRISRSLVVRYFPESSVEVQISRRVSDCLQNLAGRDETETELSTPEETTEEEAGSSLRLPVAAVSLQDCGWRRGSRLRWRRCRWRGGLSRAFWCGGG